MKKTIFDFLFTMFCMALQIITAIVSIKPVTDSNFPKPVLTLILLSQLSSWAVLLFTKDPRKDENLAVLHMKILTHPRVNERLLHVLTSVFFTAFVLAFFMNWGILFVAGTEGLIGIYKAGLH